MTHSQTCNLHKEPADSTQKSHKLQLLAWDNICMLEPVYLPDGTNGCRVHYDNGTFEDISCRLNLVLDTWAKEELTSVELAKELSRAWLASRVKLRLPLPFHPDLCLAPVKCRRRQRHNDCASGYVVLHKVRTVNIKAGGGSYIYFNGRPRPVPVLESRRSILENLAYGRMVAEAYRKAHVRAVSEPSICCISPLVTRGSVFYAVFYNVFSNVLFYGSVILLQGGVIRFCSSFFMQFFYAVFYALFTGLQAAGRRFRQMVYEKRLIFYKIFIKK